MPEHRLISCVGVRYDLPLLPHFLRHYRELGVASEHMHLILQALPEDEAPLAEAREVLAAHGVTPAEVWREPYTSAAMWEHRRAVQAAHAAPDDWVLSADVDEFHEYPEPLERCLARLAGMGVTCVQGPFIDRLAPEGRLAPVAPAPDIWTQFPVTAEAIWSLGGAGAHHDRYGTVKVMAVRGHVMPSRGGHHPKGGQAGVRHLCGQPLADFARVTDPAWRAAMPFRVHHFNWTSALEGSLRRRLATPGVSEAGREYGRKVLDYVDAHGRLDLAALPRLELSRVGPDWPRRTRRLRAEAAAARLAKRARRGLRGVLGRVTGGQV